MATCGLYIGLEVPEEATSMLPPLTSKLTPQPAAVCLQAKWLSEGLSHTIYSRLEELRTYATVHEAPHLLH